MAADARPPIAGKHICITGGGISGSVSALALEQACELSNIAPMPSFRIIEREARVSTQENLNGHSVS